MNAWLRLIEKQVAFLNGIAGEIDDRNLGGATQVQIPFLESDLSIAYWRSRDVVNDQKESISKILHDISDLVPVRTFTTEDVERQLDKSNRVQTKMSEEVRDLDRTLLNEYQQVISDLPQIVSLYSALENATRQGADVEPFYFNAEAFYHSEAYKIQGDLDEQTAAYLTFKKQQEQARQVSKKEEEVVNPPWYEKVRAELQKAGHVYNEVEDGIDDGVFDTVKDTVVGLWDMVTSPHEIAEAIIHAGRHPMKTAELLANALSNSFEKNMIHGNAYTRTQWITYAVATIALSLLGTKGIDKVGKMVDVGKLAEKAGVVTKNTASAVADKINSFQSPITPNYQFAGGTVPYNTINSKGLRAMLSRINGENGITNDISKKGNIGSKGLNENIEDVKKGSPDSVREIHQRAKREKLTGFGLGEETDKITKGMKKIVTKDARYGKRKISDGIYAKLRRASPSSKVQREVNKNIDNIIGTEDFALPGKIIDKKLHADHIVSLEKIACMEGFETLTFNQQKEIANFADNFTGLSEAANTSKGSKSFTNWYIYKKENIPVNSEFRERMIIKEKELEVKIQQMIDEFNSINKKE